MVGVAGYALHEQVHRGARSTVTRATHVASGARVVLKTSAVEGPSSLALVRSQHEFSVAAPIRSAHVVSYRGVERYDHRVAVVVEAFGDCSFADMLAAERPGIDTALSVAAQVAAGLVEVHRHEVIHRAIHPGNIVVDAETGIAKIIDFAEASVLRQTPDPTQRLDGSAMPLAYVSPEQTGRMNRSVDYRTDFYSLGATLYHALAGRPPFERSDPLSLVHAQIALSPRPLSEVDPRIPRQVSRLVDKLLAKNASDRYQSARGVVADLEECLRQYRSTGTVEEFPLARHDVPERLVIPEELYGRAAECRDVLDAFRAAAEGGKLLLLVTGPSGIGKSSVVNEVHKPIVERRGTFASGKFDQLHRHAPYSALGQALTQLCRILLRAPEDELASWRTRILEGVSSNAGLIIDFVPDLERIVGPQPPVPPTGLVESQHRFDLTLASFVSVFASAEHPLVLFFDDLQWADPATLRALGALLRSPSPTHLLVLGAYRDDEVDATHPLSVAIDELRGASIELRTLRLAGLRSDEVSSLVADTVHKPPAEARDLAALVAEKTSGNPFFVDEFLRTLHDDGLLRFSPERGWTWDIQQIEETSITANVVELMVRKLERLPLATQEALRVGACVGSRFDLDLVRASVGLEAPEMRARLAPAIRERLLVPMDPNYPIGLVDVSSGIEPDTINYRYRFLHDRVQQAAYESIPEAQRPELHLRLGRLLLERTTRESRKEEVFAIVDQLNHGSALLEDGERRTELAALNDEAGKRARSSTAYNEGLAYFRRGIELLPDGAWALHYPLAFALHLGSVECAYLAGRFDEADRFADALLPRLRTPVEKAELYSIRIVLETNRGRHRRSIELGREALAALGHPMPSMRTIAPLLLVRVKVSIAMRGRRVEDLAKLPELTDPRMMAVVKIISTLSTPGYWSDLKVLFWVVHENLYLAVTHGITAAAIAGFVDYGTFLIAAERNYPRALAFGRLGLTLAKRDDAFALRCHIHFLFGFFMNAYAENHLRTSIPVLSQGVELGLESGDLLFTCFCAATIPETMFMVGDPVDDVLAEARRREREIRSFRHGEITKSLEILIQCMRCLRGETQARTSLGTDDLPESKIVTEVHAAPSPFLRGLYFGFKTILFTLFGEHREAVRTVLASDKEIETAATASIRLTEYGFFACLALIEGLRDPALDRRAIRRLLEKKRELLAGWAKSAPVNFRHKDLLVRAELAELEGRSDVSTRLYDEAIRDAAANGYHQHAALASELAGRAFARRGLPEIARGFRESARAGYERWGAIAKVDALDEADPELAPRQIQPEEAPVALDLVSVVRASQALSSEISLPSLLGRMMRVIVETAGAQRGSLLLARDGELRIEAQLDAERGRLELPSAAAPTGARSVSEGLVRYTLRTGEDVVLGDAARRGEFTRDPYVAARRSKSILCMPVRYRDRVTGVLFLENELSTDVFTSERLEVLRLLVAQAAISLENARLYDATQRLNVELTANEALLREFIEGMPVGVYVVDARGQAMLMNRTAAEVLGKGVDPSVRAEHAASVYQSYVAGTDQLYPETRSPLARALRGEASMVDDVEVRRPDRVVPLAVWGTPIRGDDGAVRYALVAIQDITAQRAAEATQARLEERLRQSERLESVGKLAGGVAHDFNNLLTPILLCSDVASGMLPSDSPLREHLADIHEAAEQAAKLTRQLLAFGGRQVLDQRVLDLNEELRGFQSMLRRLLREDIAIDLRLHPALGLVRVDPTQLQRMIINLVMNAADAMPRGGRLTLETENTTRVETPAGPCVVLRVGDTGHGMDKETVAKIFDPFFTTKSLGQGTGLGLPTVYGLVTQHGGQLSVHSEPGVGTTFEVFFPRVLDDVTEPAPRADLEVTNAPAGRDEVILVVDDDAAVRKAVQDVLGHDGYRVHAAAGVTEALTVARSLGERLDLLITDVVMPVMNGPELYAELSSKQPTLAVLFVSGYSEGAISTHGLLHPGIALLEKPFSLSALRITVREILAKRKRPSAR